MWSTKGPFSGLESVCCWYTGGTGRMPVPLGKGRKGTISQGMSIFSSWRIRKTNEEDQGRASKHSQQISKFQ